MWNDKTVKTRKIYRTIGRIISLPIVLFLLFCIAGQIFFPTQLFNMVGFKFCTVSDTHSMQPVFVHRDIIVITRYDFNRLQVGDIVSFRQNVIDNGEERTILVTHGIFRIYVDEQTGERSYLTGGANPNIPPDARLMTIDGANNTNEFVGKYRITIFRPSRLGEFFTSPWGVLAISVNVICITVLILLRVMKDGEDEDDDDDDNENLKLDDDNLVENE